MGNPFLWKVVPPSGLAPSYLFGTCHYIPDAEEFLNKKVKAVVQDADELYVEKIIPRYMRRLARNLKNLSPAQKRTKTARCSKLFHLVLNTVTPDSNFSMEGCLIKEARPNVPKRELDTDKCQTEILGSVLPYLPKWSALESFVSQVVSVSSPEPSPELLELWDAYKSGRISDIQKFTTNGLAAYKLDERNKKWIQKLIPAFQKRGNVFVGVGLAHLLGKNSVVDLLRKKGFRISRCK